VLPMNNKKPKIVFTTQLSEEKRGWLENSQFLIESEPFIVIEYSMPALWRSQVPEKMDAWIFTSKKAVKAVSPLINDLGIPKYVFAVGSKTAEMLEEIGIKVTIPEEYNARALAAMMKELDLNEVVHFCGNLKAADLGKLLGDGVNLTSIEVYETKLTEHKMDDLENFDSIVFMSPSAVRSFIKQNSVNGNMQVFCIGPTTREAAQEAGMQNSIIPEYATMDSLMESIQDFYF